MIVAWDKRIKVLMEKNLLPHALLLTGKEDSIKQMHAIQIAMALNCKAGDDAKKRQGYPFCGLCPSCKRISAGTHPDMHRISPEGSHIRIDRIRELTGALSLMPLLAKTRMVMICDAHMMNPHAANALLKMLEEPPADTVFILTAKEADDILPTIVSRCQNFRIPPMDEQLRTRILTDTGIDLQTAACLVKMENISRFFAIKPQTCDQVEARLPLWWTDHRKPLIRVIARILGKPDALYCAQELFRISEWICKKRETAKEALEIITSWLKDALVYPYFPDKLIHQDMASETRMLRNHLHEDELLAGLEAVMEVERNLEWNINLRPALEMMMLSLAGMKTDRKKSL